jgi:predicted nucleotide-binding protein (sugar kinase/HSP70/actin superfamily)
MTRKLSPEEIVFFDPYADGPCRFGQYNQGYIRVYEELGLDPKIVQSGAHNNYAEIFSGGWDSTKFALLAWDAICATDLLHKTANLLRVYEVHEGEVDDVYNRMMAELVSTVEKPGFNFPLIMWKKRELERLMHRAAQEFARVKLDRSRRSRCSARYTSGPSPSSTSF